MPDRILPTSRSGCLPQPRWGREVAVHPQERAGRENPGQAGGARQAQEGAWPQVCRGGEARSAMYCFASARLRQTSTHTRKHICMFTEVPTTAVSYYCCVRVCVRGKGHTLLPAVYSVPIDAAVCSCLHVARDLAHSRSSKQRYKTVFCVFVFASLQLVCPTSRCLLTAVHTSYIVCTLPRFPQSEVSLPQSCPFATPSSVGLLLFPERVGIAAFFGAVLLTFDELSQSNAVQFNT